MRLSGLVVLLGYSRDVTTTRRSFATLVAVLAMCSVSPGSALTAGSTRAEALVFVAEEVALPGTLAEPEIRGLVANRDLATLGVREDAALLDLRSGRWATLRSSIPLLPGAGVGNALRWEEAGSPTTVAEWEEAAQIALVGWLRRNGDALRIEPSELRLRIGVSDHGRLVQATAEREVAGLPVRGARWTAVVVAGNLVLSGATRWGDVDVDLVPSVPSHVARSILGEYVRPFALVEPHGAVSLALVPTVPADRGPEASWRHRLVWVVELELEGEAGHWEGVVDAHDGTLLEFRALHHPAARSVVGGVVATGPDPVSPDTEETPGAPMPFADLSTGGFTGTGGLFDATGTVSTSLTGEFIRIEDGCGAISESSSGDLDLGTSPAGDCETSPGSSAGNTRAARTTYFELNRMAEAARSRLPSNGWLEAPLTVEADTDLTCGGLWTGTAIRLYRGRSTCLNAGQHPAISVHEWAHGFDDNDVSGSIASSGDGGGEGLADVYAALRTGTPCIGDGFWLDGDTCYGYGDPCTEASGCSGIRTIDWADRASGTAHTLSWVRTACKTITHCVGTAYAEAIWDLKVRDLPTLFGLDAATAHEVVTRLTVLGGGNVSGWFDLLGPEPGEAGCAATHAYLQFLAADDDDGDLTNGTPHMSAIATAFDRHEIGCTPAFGGPVVQDSGCSGAPSTAPALQVGAGDRAAHLSWTVVPGANAYRVLRADGPGACALGKTIVAETAATALDDPALASGRETAYVVQPVGVSAACLGPASACETVVPFAAGIFADGFESGDVSAWN